MVITSTLPLIPATPAVCYPHYGDVAGRLRADGVFDDAPEADGVLDAVIAELERKGAA